MDKAWCRRVLIREQRELQMLHTQAGRQVGVVGGAVKSAGAIRQCLDSFELPKILQDFPLYRIFRRRHRALNVGKKITNCIVYL
jgi:hypothetical protein